MAGIWPGPSEFLKARYGKPNPYDPGANLQASIDYALRKWLRDNGFEIKKVEELMKPKFSIGDVVTWNNPCPGTYRAGEAFIVGDIDGDFVEMYVRGEPDRRVKCNAAALKEFVSYCETNGHAWSFQGVCDVCSITYDAWSYQFDDPYEEGFDNDIPASEVGPMGDETWFEEANRIVNGQRQDDYGDPERMSQRVAQAWSAILGVEVTPRQYCWLMVAMKAIRDQHKPKRDNPVDAHGYLILMEKQNEEAATRETR